MKVKVIKWIDAEFNGRQYIHHPGDVLAEDHSLHPFTELLDAGLVEPIRVVPETADKPSKKK